MRKSIQSCDNMLSEWVNKMMQLVWGLTSSKKRKSSSSTKKSGQGNPTTFSRLRGGMLRMTSAWLLESKKWDVREWKSEIDRVVKRVELSEWKNKLEQKSTLEWYREK